MTSITDIRRDLERALYHLDEIRAEQMITGDRDESLLYRDSIAYKIGNARRVIKRALQVIKSGTGTISGAGGL